MALERRLVILGIVAERRAALFEPAAVARENVPIMVSDLVAEMAEQAAIGLGQFRPALLDLGAVGFRQRDRHHPIVVSGHHFGAGRMGRIGQKLERQPVGGVFGAGLERQLPAQEAIEQPMLGELDVAPGGKVRWLRDIGNRIVVPAGDAETIRAFGGGKPIADVIVRVGAETALSAVARQRRPGLRRPPARARP